jgi:hypothetical protein
MSRLPAQVQGQMGGMLDGALGTVREGANSYLRKVTSSSDAPMQTDRQRCDQIERVISDQNLLIRLDKSCSNDGSLPTF